MRQAFRLLVGCGLVMAAEATVVPSSAPALIPSMRCAGLAIAAQCGVPTTCSRDGDADTSIDGD